MKPAFIHNLVNSPFEDPTLFVRIVREKRAFLFDTGNISKLQPGDLQKITDVFITHTHIDHFIGFDTLVRAILRRDTPLRVYGPPNITDCIEGKLRGYTWNLIKEYPIKIDVCCVNDNKKIISSFHAKNNFQRTGKNISTFDGILLKEPLFTIRAIQLDHQIPCLAFSIDEEFHINIDKASLKSKGLSVGPWLADLKNAIRERRPGNTQFVVSRKRYSLKELRDVVKITKGQKISYVTDISMNNSNIKKIIEFVRNSDTLYCEAYFLDEDRDRALERFHLTAKITGMIAREAQVNHLVAMHFSPKYRAYRETPGDEAMREFSSSPS
jgi:ribonuclease Z